MRVLITGVAGFVGSHLLQRLLAEGHDATGLDNFFSGSRENLEAVRAAVPPENWARFRFLEGDLRDPEIRAAACEDVDTVFHQASLVSVPLSVEQPELTRDIIVNGGALLLNDLSPGTVFVHASTSAVYGDSSELPKREDMELRPLSPYAAGKAEFEQLATAARARGIRTMGLRYFNLYGPRQSADGGYAAVIPRWADAIKANRPPIVYGDGLATRDFLHVSDAVTANLLAASAAGRTDPASLPPVVNIATGEVTSLRDLLELMRGLNGGPTPAPETRPGRAGDIPHSSADITLARQTLGFTPSVDLRTGLRTIL